MNKAGARINQLSGAKLTHRWSLFVAHSNKKRKMANHIKNAIAKNKTIYPP
jgi:hypothetical protein